MRALLLFLITSLLSSAALAGTTPPPSALPGQAAKAPERALLERMTGTWDVTYEIYDKDGKLRQLPGQVTYSWILDGRALQEVWSDVDGKQVKPYATTIGYLDA